MDVIMMMTSSSMSVKASRDELLNMPGFIMGTKVPKSGLFFQLNGIFAMYNDIFSYENPRAGRGLYQGIWGLRKEQRADNCQECEECVEVCPQKIAIPEWLKKAHELLTSP